MQNSSINLHKLQDLFIYYNSPYCVTFQSQSYSDIYHYSFSFWCKTTETLWDG